MTELLGASPDGDRAAGLRPQPATPSSRSSIPSAGIERIDIPEFHRRLRAQGVAEGRMTIDGKGKSEPVAPNTTDAERMKNRRVVFMVTEK